MAVAEQHYPEVLLRTLPSCTQMKLPSRACTYMTPQVMWLLHRKLRCVWKLRCLWTEHDTALERCQWQEHILATPVYGNTALWEKARMHVGEKISEKSQLQLTPGCTMNAKSSSGSGFEEVLWWLKWLCICCIWHYQLGVIRQTLADAVLSWLGRFL